MKRKTARLALLITFSTPAGVTLAQTPPAFPGAEGFGASATMRKNNLPFAGEIYHVTSLADTLTQGTLRHAVRESGFPAAGRIVVFDVGGTINLTASLDIKNINGLYIAGQTAPSPITIYGDTSQITSSSGKVTQNVIVRNVAFRKGTGNGSDSVTFAGSGLGNNLILDHVSASWSEDEILSVANNNTNVTVQYSMINDALVNNHAYGSLIRPRINSTVSFHHNLYAHNASRQARFGTYDAMKLTSDFRNNVVFNWRDRASYAGGSSEAEQEFVDVNFVGNYFIAGPGTTGLANRAFTVDKNVDVRAYQSGNFIDPDKQLNPGGQPNGSDTGWNMWGINNQTDQTLVQMGSEFAMAPVATQSAIDAYNQVVGYVGSNWWNRDAIDSRVINNVLTNTGPTIGAAAPNAAELNGVLTAPQTNRPAGWDTDNDGMPNAWETAHGLNPNQANPGADFDNDGYSDTEEYINELGAFPAPRPITWTGGATGRYALNGNWDTWQPSRFDTVLINDGKATVDAVGQHAGNLKIGQAATAGEVEIASGWLNVAGTVDIGKATAGGTGKLRLNGGSVAIGTGLNLQSTGTLILGGGTIALNATAPFNINGGTVQTTVNQGISMNATLGAAGGTIDTTDKTVTWSGNLSGTGGLTKTGTGTLILTGDNTYSGTTNVQAGTLEVKKLQPNSAVNIQGGTLKVQDSGPTLPGHPAGDDAFVSRPSSLIIAAGATLDLANNDLILNYTGASPAAAIEALVASAYNITGDWQGNGITSSIAALDGNYVLAVADNAELAAPFGTAQGGPLFAGVDVDLTTVLVKFTHRADLNLDGVVTPDDAAVFGTNFSENDPATRVLGDMDYDGVFTPTDAAIFGTFYDEAVQSLPEPGAALLLGATAWGILGRRGRNYHASQHS